MQSQIFTNKAEWNLNKKTKAIFSDTKVEHNQNFGYKYSLDFSGSGSKNETEKLNYYDLEELMINRDTHLI